MEIKTAFFDKINIDDEFDDDNESSVLTCSGCNNNIVSAYLSVDEVKQVIAHLQGAVERHEAKG